MIKYTKNMRKYIGHERLLIVGASVFIHKDGKLLLKHFIIALVFLWRKNI